jgi:transposase
MTADSGSFCETGCVVQQDRREGVPEPARASGFGDPESLRSLQAQLEALRSEVGELREEAAFWKAEALKYFREAQCWQRKYERPLKQIKRLEEENAALKAEVRSLRGQLFGRKSEKGKAVGKERKADKADKGSRRPRGQQPGSRGHGRRDHSHLPAETEVSDLPEDQRRCPCCGLPYAEFPGTEDSETIEIEVRAHRRVIRRKRYRQTCQCPEAPGIITAPGPPRLLAKGILGVSVWTHVLLDKFLFYRPTHRLLEDLRLRGLDLAAGTVTDGLRRLVPLFEPIYEGIAEQVRRGAFWSADETRWMVFDELGMKLGHRWYLWAYQSATAVLFQLDPSRGHTVPEGHFRDAGRGILMVDRYSAYQAMKQVRAGDILLAFCWAHARRDFVGVGKSWPKLADWAAEWLGCIRQLYHLNRQRLQPGQEASAVAEHDGRLRDAVASMAATRDEQLANNDLHPACRKTLKSLAKHWKGLTLFVDHPQVPMDNNHTERVQRGPVVGRKNYYGSGSVWRGELAAMLFSLFATLKLHRINPRCWLTAYLEACAAAGGKPPSDAAAFLPWNLSDESKQAMRDPSSTARPAHHSP